MLRTNFLGLELKNPVIIAAGPWNRDGRSLHKSIAAGAGAVVTESIVSDTMLDVRPRIACDSNGAQNIRKYPRFIIHLQNKGNCSSFCLIMKRKNIVFVFVKRTAADAYLLGCLLHRGCPLGIQNPLGFNHF